MDIINEEESQFLKTLSRGRNLLNRTIAKLDGNNSILPGEYLCVYEFLLIFLMILNLLSCNFLVAPSCSKIYKITSVHGDLKSVLLNLPCCSVIFSLYLLTHDSWAKWNIEFTSHEKVSRYVVVVRITLWIFFRWCCLAVVWHVWFPSWFNCFDEWRERIISWYGCVWKVKETSTGESILYLFLLRKSNVNSAYSCNYKKGSRR